MQTPLQLDIWLQSYKEFDNAKNNIKQRALPTSQGLQSCPARQTFGPR